MCAEQAEVIATSPAWWIFSRENWKTPPSSCRIFWDIVPRRRLCGPRVSNGSARAPLGWTEVDTSRRYEPNSMHGSKVFGRYERKRGPVIVTNTNCSVRYCTPEFWLAANHSLGRFTVLRYVYVLVFLFYFYSKSARLNTGTSRVSCVRCDLHFLVFVCQSAVYRNFTGFPFFVLYELRMSSC